MEARVETIAVHDPSTEQQIGEIADGGAAAVDLAVARARETFDAGAWHGKTPSERTRILFRAADLIEQRAVVPPWPPHRIRLRNGGWLGPSGLANGILNRRSGQTTTRTTGNHNLSDRGGAVRTTWRE